jgi:hypothetical protein
MNDVSTFTVFPVSRVSVESVTINSQNVLSITKSTRAMIPAISHQK